MSSSRTPVLRAGYANVILFILAIAVFICNQVLTDTGAMAWVRGVTVVGLSLIGLKAYTCALSRVHVRNGQVLVLVGPFSEQAIELSEITAYSIGGIPASQFVSLKIRVRSSAWPRFHFFVAVATNFGGYAETKARLEAFMREVLNRA